MVSCFLQSHQLSQLFPLLLFVLLTDSEPSLGHGPGFPPVCKVFEHSQRFLCAMQVALGGLMDSTCAGFC